MNPSKTLSEDDIKIYFLAQYQEQKKALDKTHGILCALGVRDFEGFIKVPEIPSASEAPELFNRNSVFEKKLKLTSLVREACHALKSDITRDAVVSYIHEKYPEYELKEHSVGTLLTSAMVKEGLVEMQEDSIGGQQYKYKIKNSIV